MVLHGFLAKYINCMRSVTWCLENGQSGSESRAATLALGSSPGSGFVCLICGASKAYTRMGTQPFSLVMRLVVLCEKTSVEDRHCRGGSSSPQGRDRHRNSTVFLDTTHCTLAVLMYLCGCTLNRMRLRGVFCTQL